MPRGQGASKCAGALPGFILESLERELKSKAGAIGLTDREEAGPWEETGHPGESCRAQG